MSGLPFVDHLAGKGGMTQQPVPLHDTLRAIEAFVHEYVVLSDEQAIIVALWTAHTHAIDAADCTPYLQITSATKRAGKTRKQDYWKCWNRLSRGRG